MSRSFLTALALLIATALAQTTPNCLMYDHGSTECIFCQEGFFASKGRCQIQFIPDCERFIPNKNECAKFYSIVLQPNSERRLDARMLAISNCKKMDNTNQMCTECMENFYIDYDTNSCLKNDIPNCTLVRNNARSCKICENKHYLSSPTECLKIAAFDYCAHSLPNQDMCLTCQGGFILSNNKCVRNDPDPCTNWIEGHCHACARKFYLDPQALDCRPIPIDHCDAYDILTVSCSKCDDGFNLSVDQKACHAEAGPARNLATDSCLKIEASSNECLECPSLHYINSSRFCSRISEVNCDASNGKIDSCVYCKAGYYLSAGAPQCKPQAIDGCKIYKANENVCVLF